MKSILKIEIQRREVLEYQDNLTKIRLPRILGSKDIIKNLRKLKNVSVNRRSKRIYTKKLDIWLEISHGR